MSKTFIKLKSWVREQSRFSVYEIAIGGLIVGLMCVNALPVFSLDMGLMRVGISMVWPILLGLITRLPLGVLCAIIGDNLMLLIRGGIGQWMIEYAIIFPLITVFSYGFKALIKSNKHHVFVGLVVVVNVLIVLGVVVTLALFQNFKSKSISEETGIDFSTPLAEGVIYAMTGLMIVVSFTGALLTYLAYKQRLKWVSYDKMRLYYGLYLIVAVIIIIFIWAYGPVAYIRYLNLYISPNKNYYDIYELYLVPRILKTVVILPLYTAIIAPMYFASEVTRRHLRPSTW